MNKEQYQEFIEFTMNIYANRDAYSRGKIVEDIRDKVTEIYQASKKFYCTDEYHDGEDYRCKKQCLACDPRY